MGFGVLPADQSRLEHKPPSDLKTLSLSRSIEFKMTDTFGGFQSSSFYGKPLGGSLFTSLVFHTPRIEQTNYTPNPKRSRSLSVDSKKAKKIKTSLFSGVSHGLKKPKPKKSDTKKYINTDSDKVLKSNKKKRPNEQSKENKPLNESHVTPSKAVKSASKKSSNKKSKEGNIKLEDESFRYHFQMTPEHMRVAKALPYSGFAPQTSTSSKKGKKKLFSPEDEEDQEFLKSLSSSKKIKLSNKKTSPVKNKKTSPKKLFSTEKQNETSCVTPKQSVSNMTRSPSTRSAKKVVYETIQLSETPSPQHTPRLSKLRASVTKSTPDTVSPRKSARLSAIAMNSPRSTDKTTSTRKTPTKSCEKYDEPMLVDSPKLDGRSPSVKKTSTPCSTPMLTRSSLKKFPQSQDSPKRLLSSKKKLFHKEPESTTPGEYFEKDVLADSFNVFDILNDSLDGIEMLDGSCNALMLRDTLFSPKKFNDEEMNVSHAWDSPPVTTTHNNSAHYTFPKVKDLEQQGRGQTVNTFPRSTRASRKCVRQLTPNPRMYGGSCKKTLKTTFDLSQLQLSSPSTKCCPVCAYKGDTEDSEHVQIHSIVLKLKHYEYKYENVVADFSPERARIICITSQDKMWLQKAALVIEIADSELGFAESECPVLKDTQVYLYVTKQTIVGLAVANPLTRANRLISLHHEPFRGLCYVLMCSIVSPQVYLYVTKQTILAVANPLTRANRLISSTMNHSVDYAMSSCVLLSPHRYICT
ncbi:hypothetical protein M8J75_015508 [Diaphorina citri]|nr:hypothetical protein M8J75_015508 [Diaphorina citri]